MLEIKVVFPCNKHPIRVIHPVFLARSEFEGGILFHLGFCLDILSDDFLKLLQAENKKVKTSIRFC